MRTLRKNVIHKTFKQSLNERCDTRDYRAGKVFNCLLQTIPHHRMRCRSRNILSHVAIRFFFLFVLGAFRLKDTEEILSLTNKRRNNRRTGVSTIKFRKRWNYIKISAGIVIITSTILSKRTIVRTIDPRVCDVAKLLGLASHCHSPLPPERECSVRYMTLFLSLFLSCHNISPLR